MARHVARSFAPLGNGKPLDDGHLDRRLHVVLFEIIVIGRSYALTALVFVLLGWENLLQQCGHVTITRQYNTIQYGKVHYNKEYRVMH